MEHTTTDKKEWLVILIRLVVMTIIFFIVSYFAVKHSREKTAAMRNGDCEFFVEGSADRLECLILHDRLMGGKLKEGR